MWKLLDRLDTVMKCMNYIKARPLNQHLFACLRNEMCSNHIGLLLCPEVHWLSPGQVLKRVVELQEVITFFKETETNILTRKIQLKQVYGKHNISSIHI